MERTPEAFFELIIRENERGLHAFVRACVHDVGDAEDIVQQVFIAAWDSIDRYDSTQAFGPWLRGVARHKIAEHFRRTGTRRRHVRVLPPEAVAAISDEFDRLLVGRAEALPDCLTALRECLAALSPCDGEIVRHAYHGGQTCPQIAAQLGETVEAIKKRLQRARAQLRDCILGKLAAEADHA